MKVHRPEVLLCAFYLAVVGWFSQAFYALELYTATVVRGLFWALALVWVWWATRERVDQDAESATERPLAVRVGLKTAQAVVAVGLAYFLVRMHGYGYVTALIMSPTACLVGMAVEGLLLVLCAWLAWRRPSIRPIIVAVSGTLLFAGSLLFVVLTIWMWRPPDPGVCEEVIDTKVVQRLSPAAWPAEASQPYSLQYLPEKDWLVAAYKTAGNLHFSFWVDPAANRIFAVDVGDTSVTTEVPLGEQLPFHMAYEPSREELIVSRTGPDDFSLDVLSLADLPEIRPVRSVEMDFPVNGERWSPTSGAYIVLGQHGDFSIRTPGELEEVYRLNLALQPGHVAMTLDIFHDTTNTKAYVSVFVYPMVEVDLTTRELRPSPEVFGGGQLSGVDGHPELFRSDWLFDRIDVLALPSMRVTRRVYLDYAPRPLQADIGRDLLMVGDWFGGVVHFYRLSSLEPLGRPVPVGPYLRDFGYDRERGLLFAASKCGIYQVSLDAALAEN